MKKRLILILIINFLRKYKKLLVPAGEFFIFSGILILSYWLKYGILITIGLLLIPLKVLIFWMFKLYRISFRYISLSEIIEVLKASFIASCCLLLIIPATVVFIDFVLTFLAASGLRLFFRWIYSANIKSAKGKRTLIIGAGRAGEQLLIQIKGTSVPLDPVAFIDDDKDKQGCLIHGVKVAGTRRDIPGLVKDLAIESIIISMPSASSKQLKEIMFYIKSSGITDVKIVPGIFSILKNGVSLNAVKNIDVEDILSRESVTIVAEEVSSYITGKKVLITGAGGSIGSELCRQVANLSAAELIMVDRDDTASFYIDNDIKANFKNLAKKTILADIRDASSMRGIFLRYKPDIVLHAAAYKHVSVMEENCREAVLNNIGGTMILAEAAIATGVKKFIFISTDKAVNPVNIMGATKRVAENLLKCLNGANCKTCFISVRFGNVLESRGSFIPLLKDQIKKGGPVTITHPDMMRYFMSITEAVHLVLEAGALGKGGEIFVLDMGEPLKILDLAREIIRFYGLEPDKDIPIVFTGIRPGEKLCEALFTSEERRLATSHNKIFITHDTNNFGLKYLEKIGQLIKEAKNNAALEKIIFFLKELLPAYPYQSQ